MSDRESSPTPPPPLVGVYPPNPSAPPPAPVQGPTIALRSSLNPFAPPFLLGGASSSRSLDGDLPEWLHYNPPSSCSSKEVEEPQSYEGKGKASAVILAGSKPVGQSKPRSSFMEDARRPSAFQAGDVRGRLSRDGGRRSYVGQL
jgi:hypothetical protein